VSTDFAVTWLTWVLAGGAAIALVLLVLIRGWAGRTMVIGAAVLLLTPTFAVRQQIGSIPIENPEPLCTGGVDWFGVHLTGRQQLCARYR